MLYYGVNGEAATVAICLAEEQPEWAESKLKDSIAYHNAMISLVLHPETIPEAMAQQINDTYEEDGLAFCLSYVVTDYFGGKGITKLLKANPKIKNPFKKKKIPKVIESGNYSIDDLINGLEETTNGKGIARNFEASGRYEQTLKDFESLNPTDVKNIQTKYGSGKVGTLNDGTKVVARHGSTTGGAALKIKVSNSKVYKIRY